MTTGLMLVLAVLILLTLLWCVSQARDILLRAGPLLQTTHVE